MSRVRTDLRSDSVWAIDRHRYTGGSARILIIRSRVGLEHTLHIGESMSTFTTSSPRWPSDDRKGSYVVGVQAWWPIKTAVILNYNVQTVAVNVRGGPKK